MAPFDEAEIARALAWLEQAPGDTAALEAFGEQLYRAVFTGQVARVYEGARLAEGGPLRLRLILDSPLVARIPWELLYDPDRQTFVALTVPLVRGASLIEPARQIQAHPPLRVLVVDAFPAGVPKLQNQWEVSGIRQALTGLVKRRRAEVVTLSHITLRRLQDALREAADPAHPRPYHALHFIGHGHHDLVTGETFLLFEDEAGEVDAVGPQELAAILRPYDVKLVFLNACGSVQSSTLDVAQGFAPTLMASGVPAVVGMQAMVGDDAARRFALDFYAAVADGRPVDAALLDARQLTRGAAGAATPVCYLRTQTGQILESGALGPAPLTRATWREWLSQNLTPRRVAAGLISLLSLVGLLLGLVMDVGSLLSPEATPIPPMSESGFNVAVAEFGQLDARGAVMASQQGRELANDVYAAVDSVAQELRAAGFDVEVRPPALTRRVEGPDSPTRAADAQALADSMAADLLIYANLQATENGTVLQPEFYLSNRKLPFAEELGGQYEFGRPLEAGDDVARNIVAAQLLTDSMKKRANALAKFAIALGYLALDRISEAQDYFAQSEQSGGWVSADGRSQGQEILRLFQGNAALRQGQLEAAAGHFSAALAAEPRYARARLGLGLVKAALASGGGACQAGKVDPAGLRAAENEYKDALLNGSLPPLADVPTKGALVLGRLFACISVAQVDDRWADAQRQYGKVLDDYQNGDPAAKTRLRNLAAEAHADLALLKMNTAGKDWTGAYREAASAYGQASDLTRRLDRKAVFQLWIGRIHLYLGESRASSTTPGAGDRGLPAVQAVEPRGRPAGVRRIQAGSANPIGDPVSLKPTALAVAGRWLAFRSGPSPAEPARTADGHGLRR